MVWRRSKYRVKVTMCRKTDDFVHSRLGACCASSGSRFGPEMILVTAHGKRVSCAYINPGAVNLDSERLDAPKPHPSMRALPPFPT